MDEQNIFREFGTFWLFFWDYLYKHARGWFEGFEGGKDAVVDVLYQRRGKYARPFMHTGMVGLLFLGVTVGPAVLSGNKDALAQGELPRAQVLGMSTEQVYTQDTSTISGEGVLAYRGGEVLDYTVQEGETLKSISSKFNLKIDTILWANGLDNDRVKIRAGQTLKIPPLDGVIHKVAKGETVYSIANKYSGNPQAMVDYPFNTFTNDETFALAVGQVVMVPDGIMPDVQPIAPSANLASKLTPNAGAVSATGKFVWPASGRITQSFSWYHKGIDIASHGGGPIVAADSGRVLVAGWPDNSGYGNRVIIDHGNGYVTLYAHMARFSVVAGQMVNRGDKLGDMGSTGRSTGVHCHFEIRAGGVNQNPLNFLQ